MDHSLNKIKYEDFVYFVNKILSLKAERLYEKPNLKLIKKSFNKMPDIKKDDFFPDLKTDIFIMRKENEKYDPCLFVSKIIKIKNIIYVAENMICGAKKMSFCKNFKNNTNYCLIKLCYDKKNKNEIKDISHEINLFAEKNKLEKKIKSIICEDKLKIINPEDGSNLTLSSQINEKDKEKVGLSGFEAGFTNPIIIKLFNFEQFDFDYICSKNKEFDLNVKLELNEYDEFKEIANLENIDKFDVFFNKKFIDLNESFYKETEIFNVELVVFDNIKISIGKENGFFNLWFFINEKNNKIIELKKKYIEDNILDKKFKISSF